MLGTYLDHPICMTWPLPPVLEHADSDDMWDWQAGRCGMCGAGLNLVLDHDHETGLLRGYLCRRCNRLEGTQYDVPRMTLWRNGWNPATLMGVDEQYILLNGRTEAENAAMWARAFPPPTEEEERAAMAAIDNLFAPRPVHSQQSAPAADQGDGG